MEDSPVIDLCRKIYKKHKAALDIIYEHKPDMQLEIKELLLALIRRENNRMIIDHSIKSYIRFAPKEWDKHPTQLRGNGWTQTNRLILFEFKNLNKSLKLKLILGPSNNSDIRQSLYNEIANSPHDPLHLESFTGKYTQLYSFDILTKKDLDGLPLEELSKKIEAKWEKFLQDKFQASIIVVSEAM